MSSTKHVMTQEQQEIFDYCPMSMVITAPAGCGKTEALAYRAKGLLDRYDFAGNGRRLLIVSFTNQAKDNINERLKKHLDIHTLRYHVTVHNFHGLAARIIKAHGSIIGLDNEWTIANSDWIRGFVQYHCNKEIKDQVKATLQEIKLGCLTDSQVMAKIQKINGPVGEGAEYVEKARITSKVITYDDQIRTALWILLNERVAMLYQNHFFAALVDEFQDLTPQQLQLVQALCGENVTYAGDVAQGIYSFAGADARSTFQSIIGNGKKQVKLLESFRSAPAVLNAVNSLFPRTTSDKLTAAFPEHWGNGGHSSYVLFEREGDEAEWVVQMCQLILKHCPKHRVGIIARVVFRLDLVKDALVSHGIGFTDWGGGLFRSKVATTLRNICDDLSDNSFEGMSDAFFFIRRRAIEIQGSPSEELEDACGWLFDQLVQCGMSKLPDIRRRIDGRKGNETIATRGGIHCLTGHAGKGQQFDWVFIVGLEQGSIPYYRAESAEEIDEEARVLSVMISRARIGFIATSTSVSPYGRPRVASEFLEYLQEDQNFLFGKDQIESWFAEADWSAIAQM